MIYYLYIYFFMDKEHEQKPISALTANFSSNTQLAEKHVDFIEFETNYSEAYRKGSNDDQFQQIHQQYLEHKLTQKKELQRRKRQIFGPSSSQEDDIGGSESVSDSDRRKSTMQQQKKFMESRSKKEQMFIAKLQKCQIYFAIKKVKESWSLEQLSFQQQQLLITDRSILLKQIHKIKIIQAIVIADAHKIKLSTIDENELFIAANNKPYKDLPLNYYIFAYILQQKLINMNRKLFKCTAPYIPGIPGIPVTLVKNSLNYGKIFKKSQILGKWEERLIVINRQGIFSYKTFNQKHSMFIASSSIRQLWTRFEVDEGHNLLVIKILHSSSTKTEFGLPLSEMLDRGCWLFSFYQLMFPS